jgi:hypothetical protein
MAPILAKGRTVGASRNSDRETRWLSELIKQKSPA